MSDWSFNNRLSQLERKYGDNSSSKVPRSVLHFFLKESNGDMDKCIRDLEKNNWIHHRRSSEVTPADAVNDYQRASSQQQFLSSSNDSALKFRQQLHSQPQPTPPSHHHNPEPGGITNDRDYFGEVFTPHPPLLPNNTSTGVAGGDRNLTNWHTPSSQPSSNHPPPPAKYGASSSVSVPGPPLDSSRYRHPGYTKQLSEADKGMILRRQRECNEQAMKEKDSIEARLLGLKQDVILKNEQLMTLKRQNSTATIPNEEDMEFMKIIINTLESDIKDEEEKRKRRDWACKYCGWINNYVMTACDSCTAPRPLPLRHSSSSGSTTGGGGHSPLPLPRTGGYNYR